MATPRESLDLDVQNLEKEIECPVCHEHYDDPRVLPCLHYYCRRCIHFLAFGKDVSTRPFLCPECRTQLNLTEKDVEELRPAFFVNRFKTTILSTLEGYSLTKSRGQVAECRLHQELLKLYCFTCDKLICRDCVLKDHKDCNYEFVSKLAPEARKKQLEQVRSVRSAELELKKSRDAIESAVDEVRKNGDKTANEIHAHFEELRQILDDRKQEVLLETEQMVQSKMDALQQQKEEVSKSSAAVRGILEQVEDCANRYSDAEVVANSVSMLKKVENATKLQNTYGDLNIAVKLTIETKFDCSNALRKFLQSEIRIGPEEANPGRSEVVLDKANPVEVGALHEVILIVKNADGNVCSKTCDVSSRLSCLRTKDVTECDVMLDSKSRYCIRFTPSNRGRHTLAVLVNKTAVGGSPFSVFVSVHPGQLGRPVDEWPDVVQVTGIAANTAGEIIVTEESGEISVRDFAGKKLKSVLNTDHKLKSTYDIAVDADDNIYCGDYLSDRIFVCDRNCNGGRVLKVPVIKKGRRGIAVSRDEVFICEQNEVKVYDKNFTLLRQFTSEHLTLTRFVSKGEDGLLYVTDKHKAAVQVFKDGALVRSIGLGKDGEQILPNPLGLCVFGEYMYVTDYSKSGVCVFTTGGEFVASFGEKGSDRGSFVLPHGVCVDRDGYVYVADRSNNRVQVF